MSKTLSIVVFFVTTLCGTSTDGAFVPQYTSRSHMLWRGVDSNHKLGLLLMAKKKKKKLSFAEKQKRRAEKRLRQPSAPSTPANIEFWESKEEQPQEQSSDEDAPEKQRAREILNAQRESVSMLTHVRECVDALPMDDIIQSLEKDGYAVVDDFCKDDAVIDQLQQEGRVLQEDDHMELDVSHGIGSGEYVTSIDGGQEQYKYCPRSIEWVVSVTKNLPEKLTDYMSLDASASMGSMRTYSRKARLASIALLTGKEDEEDAGLESVDRPFDVIVPSEKEESDSRRLTLLYYPVISERNVDCGGGVTFEKDNALVRAKRDRLVLLKSDTCRHRQEAYKGRDSDGLEFASCIELHLVKQTSQ